MLTTEANDRLARVGPGTPGGELMRRYWIPIAPYAQLLDEDVIKIRVLGEDLVLYKDRQGRMGLIGDTCLHRCANLQWGIPDDEGLRCPYHGWMYDATGQCIEPPPGALEARALHLEAEREEGGSGLVQGVDRRRRRRAERRGGRARGGGAVDIELGPARALPP